MVRTILAVGIDGHAFSSATLEVVGATTGAEALDLISRRTCDAVAVGRVPDVGIEELIHVLSVRHPRLPLVVCAESLSGSASAQVWELVTPGSPSRLGDVLARAAEVGWLRREQRRTEPGEEAPRREVESTFERGSIRDMERLMIVERLERLNQNRTRSAESLDISVRTLRNKLREYREKGIPGVCPPEPR